MNVQDLFEMENIVEKLLPLESEESDEERDDKDDHLLKKPKEKDSSPRLIDDDAIAVDDYFNDDLENSDEEIEEIDKFEPEIEEVQRRTNILPHQKEDIIDYLANKYGEKSSSYEDFWDEDHVNSDVYIQQSLMPGILDPKLYVVKCQIGKEKATVLQLMCKYMAYEKNNEPLQIISVIAPASIKGIIYIEAYKQPYVQAAIEGISYLKYGQKNQLQVPNKEMTQVFRVVKDEALRKGQWVRFRKTIYKGDIAQIDYVDLSENKVHLKLLPRIDYTRIKEIHQSRQIKQDTAKRKRNKPPAAEILDINAIRRIGGRLYSDGEMIVFEGNRYSGKGFLYKAFPLNAIVTEDVNPTLSEIKKFNDSPESLVLDISEEANSRNNHRAAGHNFSVNDNVIVTTGDLVNLEGSIISVFGEIIMVMPKNEDLREALEFRASELKKVFKIGDHVRVLAGLFKGHTGFIIRVEHNRVVLLSNLTLQELELLPRDLQLSTDLKTECNLSSQFNWGDLVHLDPQTVGVIVDLEKEHFHVLNMYGKVVKARPQSLFKRRESRLASTLDTVKNTVQRNDIVLVIDGPHSGRSGKIKHLYRNFAFLHSYLDNGGLFVCNTRHLRLAGDNKADTADPAGLIAGFMSPIISSPMNLSGDDRGSGSRGGRGNGRGVRWDRELIGKTVKIIAGAYKGSLGIVKNASGTVNRVELQSPCQHILVRRSHLVNIDEAAREGSFTCFGKNPVYGTRSHKYLRVQSKTPVNESIGKIPGYGSQTPMYDASQTPTRTPTQIQAWDPTITDNLVQSTDCETYDLPSHSPTSKEYQSTDSSSSVAHPNSSEDTLSQAKPSKSSTSSIEFIIPGECGISPSTTRSPCKLQTAGAGC